MTLQVVSDAAVTLSELALDIAAQPDSSAIVNRVTELATKIVDCAAADIIQITKTDQLRIIAASDPGLSELTGQAWRRWPHRIMSDPGTAPASTSDMLLQRNSYLQQLRSTTGITAELIVPLVAGQSNHGYLRFLFAEIPVAHADRAVITAFCAHATLALDRAALLVQVENLSLALEGNRTIAAAVGVLMSRHHITYAEGLERLTTASQNTNRRLRDLATDVLDTGGLSRHPAAAFDRPAAIRH